jgi:hypothetical protein
MVANPRGLTCLGLVLTALLGCSAPEAADRTRVSLAPAKPALMVYKGAGCDGRVALPEFERFVGRQVDGVVDFLDQSSWSAFESSARWIADCWAQTPYDLVLSVPMLTREPGDTLRAGAEGAYDARFASLARTLVSNGQADAILRVGWEFDGDWFPWRASRDPQAFVPYYRRIVQTMRTVPGARFTFVWNFNAGENASRPDVFYPGDDVVDVIAADVYNQSWHAGDADPAARRRSRHAQPYGLDWLASFARAHRKPIAIPEWGTGLRPDGHGFGDDPEFIADMAAWIASHPVVFHGYWDYPADDYNAQLSQGRYPRAGAEFKRQFGPGKN